MRRSLSCLALVFSLTCWLPFALANPSWSNVYLEAGQKNSVMALTAVDGDHAWAIGVKDNNGNSEFVGLKYSGTAFVAMTLPVATGYLPLMFTTILFADAQEGYLAGLEFQGLSALNRIWRTTDGGTSWTPVAQLAASVDQLQVIRDGTLYAAGGGWFHHSTDGQTWSSVALPAAGTDVAATGVFMLNPDCGWVVGGKAPTDEDPTATDGAVWHTDDGGETWAVLAEGLPYHVRRASFVAGNLGWLVGYDDTRGVIARTDDGGETWVELEVPDHPALPTVCMLSACLTDPTPVTSMEDVRFWDAERGIALGLACTGGCAAGEDPTYLAAFLRTYDGGATWNYDADFEGAMPDVTIGPLSMPGVMTGLYAMAFPDPNHGFLGGQHLMTLAYEADFLEDPPATTMPSCTSTAGDGGVGPRPDSGDATGPHETDDHLLYGCGCAAASAPAAAPWLLAMALVGGLLFRRRRRR
jgi:MYXO-CTERM domain-containing protein